MPSTHRQAKEHVPRYPSQLIRSECHPSAGTHRDLGPDKGLEGRKTAIPRGLGTGEWEQRSCLRCCAEITQLLKIPLTSPLLLPVLSPDPFLALCSPSRTCCAVSRLPPAPVPPSGAAGCPLWPPTALRSRASSGCSHRRPPLSQAQRLPGSPRRGGTKLCLSFQLRRSFWEKSSRGLENKFLAWSHAQQSRRVPAEPAVAEVLGRAPVRQRQGHCGFLVCDFWMSRLGLGQAAGTPAENSPGWIATRRGGAAMPVAGRAAGDGALAQGCTVKIQIFFSVLMRRA